MACLRFGIKKPFSPINRSRLEPIQKSVPFTRRIWTETGQGFKGRAQPRMCLGLQGCSQLSFAHWSLNQCCWGGRMGSAFLPFLLIVLISGQVDKGRNQGRTWVITRSKRAPLPGLGQICSAGKGTLAEGKMHFSPYKPCWLIPAKFPWKLQGHPALFIKGNVVSGLLWAPVLPSKLCTGQGQ